MLARRRLAALSVSLLVLVAAEGLCRLLPEAGDDGLRIVLDPHPTRIWALSAPVGAGGTPPYRLDADGLRATVRQGAADAPLVVTLGDSSVFGDGVADGQTLHDRLVPALSAAGRAVRAKTLAVPGYSLVQSRIFMDELGWSLHPALLVVGNLWSDCNHDDFRDEELLAAIASPRARAERLLSRLALFRQLRGLVNRTLSRPTSWKVSWPHPGSEGVRRVPLPRYAALLDGLLDAARERGVGVLLLTLADRRAIERPTEPGSCAPYIAVQDQLGRARHVPRVDAGEAWRRSGLSADRLIWDNLHPTGEGDRVLADAIVRALVAAGWPGAPLVPGPAVPLRVPEDPLDHQEARHDNSLQRQMLSR